MVISDVSLNELELAPDHVRQARVELPAEQVELVTASPESDELRRNSSLRSCRRRKSRVQPAMSYQAISWRIRSNRERDSVAKTGAAGRTARRGT